MTPVVTHAPPDYRCPFCALATDSSADFVGLHSRPTDIICRNDLAMAFIASHWWEKNPGHVLIIPVHHFENLYQLPDNVGAAISAMSRLVAIALKCGYRCDGVSTRQHNEPAGNQDVALSSARFSPIP